MVITYRTNQCRTEVTKFFKSDEKFCPTNNFVRGKFCPLYVFKVENIVVWRKYEYMIISNQYCFPTLKNGQKLSLDKSDEIFQG